MEQEFDSVLRRKAEQLVRSRVGNLEQHISQLQREINQSFQTLLELTDAAAAIPESDTFIGEITAEVEGQVGRASAESAKLGSDLALLRESVEELGQQTTQSEVLNKLVDRVSRFAPRIVLFVVKGSAALGWAARGFEDGPGNQAIRGLSIPVTSSTILRQALDSHQTFYGAPEQQPENSLILSHLGRVTASRLLAVPLKVRNKTAAILYADSGDRTQDAINVEAIELLVYSTGLVVELTSLRARVSEGAQPPAAHAPESHSGSLTQEPQRQSPPPPPAAPQPAPVQQRQGASGELRASAPAFFKAAEAPPPPEPVRPPVPTPPPPPPAPEPPRAALSDEEEKQYNDARRFARLLVSEIKLYNEQRVIEGRNNSDLYDRLKEDIDRSRQMYDKRVAPAVASKFDYFYDELVNTLAEGDPGKLGSDFPRPARV